MEFSSDPSHSPSPFPDLDLDTFNTTESVPENFGGVDFDSYNLGLIQEEIIGIMSNNSTMLEAGNNGTFDTVQSDGNGMINNNLNMVMNNNCSVVTGRNNSEMGNISTIIPPSNPGGGPFELVHDFHYGNPANVNRSHEQNNGIMINNSAVVEAGNNGTITNSRDDGLFELVHDFHQGNLANVNRSHEQNNGITINNSAVVEAWNNRTIANSRGMVLPEDNGMANKNANIAKIENNGMMANNCSSVTVKNSGEINNISQIIPPSNSGNRHVELAHCFHPGNLANVNCFPEWNNGIMYNSSAIVQEGNGGRINGTCGMVRPNNNGMTNNNATLFEIENNGMMRNNGGIVTVKNNEQTDNKMTNNNTSMVMYQNNGMPKNNGGIVIAENNGETRSTAAIIPSTNPGNGHVEPVRNFRPENPAVVNWSREELSILREGLVKYAEDPKLIKYVNIAAMLPAKSVTDVVKRCKWMMVKELRAEGHNAGRISEDKKGKKVNTCQITNNPRRQRKTRTANATDDITKIKRSVDQILKDNDGLLERLEANVGADDNYKTIISGVKKNNQAILNGFNQIASEMEKMLPVLIDKESVDSSLPNAAEVIMPDDAQ